jgi:hypothetical protein
MVRTAAAVGLTSLGLTELAAAVVLGQRVVILLVALALQASLPELQFTALAEVAVLVAIKWAAALVVLVAVVAVRLQLSELET